MSLLPILLSQFEAIALARSTPPGIVRIVATGQLPVGYAWFTGLELSRINYPEAFAYFGTQWGAGNLTTTFNLPDLRSRMMGFAASMGGSSPANWISPGGVGGSNVAPVLGATGGADRYAALNLSQVPTHLHAFVAELLSADGTGGGTLTGYLNPSTGTPVYRYPQTQDTGSGGPISVIPPIGIFNICVSLGREYTPVTPVPPPGFAATTEEFNGPFQNWINIVTQFGADPTGVEDSTAAFQAAFAVFSPQNEGGLIQVPDSGFSGFNDMYGCVLYIPPGTYKITETLQWGIDIHGNPSTASTSYGIIGDHPDTVTLKWEGAAGGDIIWYCSIHAGAIRRITFDGNGKLARSGIRYEKIAGGISMTGGAVEDCIFKDFATAGFYNTYETGVSGTDSEMSIYRNQFYRCSIGVYVTQPEAFDYWVFCNYFEGCGIGISNNINGQFNANYNFFNGSLNYDIYISGGGEVVGTAMLGEVRWNYSTASSRFIHFDSSNTTVVANTVVNPQQVDCFEFTTRITGSGGRNKGGLLGNKVYLPSTATEGAVFHEIWQNPDSQFPIAASAFSAQAQPTFVIYKNYINLDWDIGTVISLDPRFTNVLLLDNLTNQAIDPTAPLIPAPPETVSRQVFQLRSGSLAQSVVDAAAAYAVANPGSRPVLYAPQYVSGSAGLRSYQNTIIFPPNIKMSLQGDFMGIDWRSNISEDTGHWLGGVNDPLILLQGPSLITILNMSISVTAETGPTSHVPLFGDVIVDSCDQVGGYAYMNNCFSGFHYDTCGNLVLDMTARDTGTGDDFFLPNFVKGDVANPTGLGRVLLESGTGSAQNDGTHPPQYKVEPSGKFFVRGYWGENNNTVNIPSDVYVWFDADGTGSSEPSWLSIESSRLVGGSGALVERFDNVSQFTMNNYTGNIVLLNDFYLGIATFSGTNMGAKWLSLSGDLAIVDLPSSHNSHPPLVCILNFSAQGFTNPINFSFSGDFTNYVAQAGDLAIFSSSVIKAGEGGVINVTPAGLTLIGSFLPAIDTAGNRSVNTAIFYRILDGSETNTVYSFMAGDLFNGLTVQVFRSYGGGTWGTPIDIVQEVDITFATNSIDYVAPSGPGVLHTFLAGINNQGAPTMAPTPADADVAGTATIGTSFIGYGVGDTPTSGTASTIFALPYSLGSVFIPITGMSIPSAPVPVSFQLEGIGIQMMSFNLDVFDSIPDGGSTVGFWGPRGMIGSEPSDLAAQLDALIATRVPTVVTTGETPGVTSFYARRLQCGITFMSGVYTPTIG